jgi:hypothetical protein
MAVVLVRWPGAKKTSRTIDSEEITRYIREDGVAKELFRNSGLINPTPYTLPADNATFYDSLVSVRRSIEVFLVPLKILGPNGDSIANDPDRIYADHGYLGKVREALARVEDRFTIHITRVYADSTLHDTTLLVLNRYAFLEGADTRPYVGWALGFNGIGTEAPPWRHWSARRREFSVICLLPDEPLASSHPGTYIRLTAMDTVAAAAAGTLWPTRPVRKPDVAVVIRPCQRWCVYRLMVRYNMVEYRLCRTGAVQQSPPVQRSAGAVLQFVVPVSYGLCDSIGRLTPGVTSFRMPTQVRSECYSADRYSCPARA